MKIITAANRHYAGIVEKCAESAKRQGHGIIVYDLGGLGYGVPFTVKDEGFQTDGAYNVKQMRRWGVRVSRSLFKPQVMADAAIKYPDETIVWLDADTLLLKPLDVEGDYDVGVAARSPDELKKTRMLITCGMGGLATYQGRHNSGFVVFRATGQRLPFIRRWRALVEQVGNDQLALNILIDKMAVDDTNNTLRIKKFPNAYNSKVIAPDTIVYHYKGAAKKTAQINNFVAQE